MSWLWIPILTIWFMMALKGYQCGFFRVVISFVLSVTLIILLCPVVEDILLNKTPMLQQIEEFFGNSVVSAPGADAQMDLNEQTEIINHLSALDYVKQGLIENNNNVIYRLFSANTFSEYVTRYLSRMVMKIITFLISLLVANIITRFFVDIVDVLAKLPIVGFFNRLGGVLLGCGKGLLYLWIFFLLVAVLAQTKMGGYLFREISSDPYLCYLYENNPMIQYLVAVIIE